MTEKQPEKKVGFVARTKKSAKATLNELKKVHWPTKKELLKNTGVVLTVVISSTLLVWGLDSVLSSALGLILK